MSERFPARRSRGGDLALPLAGVLLFAALACVVFGASREPGLGMVLLCVLAAVLAAAGAILAILGYAYQHLTYALTDASLRIDWLGRATIVPYAAIQGIYTGQRLAGNATARLPTWPGINVGAARVRNFGRLRFFATSADQSDLAFITVEHGGVIVSARDPNAFRAALIDRVEQSDESVTDPAALIVHQREPSAAPWTALADLWLPACVALGVLLVLGVLAIVALHASPAAEALRLPLIGFLLLAVNVAIGTYVHPRDAVLARVLWLGGVVLQLAVLVGGLHLVA